MRGVSVTGGLVSPRHLQHDEERQRGPFTHGRLHDRERREPARRIDHSRPTTSTRPRRGLIDRIDVNSTDRICAASRTTGSSSARARASTSVTLFGGWTSTARLLNHCDELENWGNLSAVIYDASRQNSTAAEVGLSLLQSVGARASLPARVQAVRLVSCCRGIAGQRRVPELPGPHAADALEHRPDDELRGRLHRSVHAGRARHPEHDGDDLRARSDAAGKRLLRPSEPARPWLPEALPDRAVSSSPVRWISSTPRTRRYVKSADDDASDRRSASRSSTLQPRTMRLALQMRF